MIRTFIALPLPEAARAFIGETIAKIGSLGLDARLPATGSIHLTLKFLGDIEEARVGEISSRLAEVAARRSTFDYRLNGLGAFPHQANPRIVWLGIEGGEPLAALQHDVEGTLCQLGFEAETRPFQPHLTLARLKSRRNIARLLDFLEQPSDLGEFTAGNFSFYQSILRPQGAAYKKLASFDLGPA